MLNPQIIIVVQNKGRIPLIINSLKNMSNAQTIPILISKPNRPKVNIVKGRVTSFIIGLIKQLIMPKTSPIRIKILMSPVNPTPAIKLVASQMPKTPEMVCKKRFLSTLAYHIIISEINQPFLVCGGIFGQTCELHLLIVKLD